MSEKLLDKTSYSLLRTNPKLTGNVKLVADGSDLYLESFNANTNLSSREFKAFKLSGQDSYDMDVYKFFQNGNFPTALAYEVYQQYEDVSVLSKYSQQYEVTYSAGARSINSESYNEDMAMLSPIWLNEQIPNYFVVFRMDNPAAVNNINALTPDEGEDDAQTAAKFSEFVLNNCTAIKTFDLTENSKLGSYLRKYRNKEDFPMNPITANWKNDDGFIWNGISYKNGGFMSAVNYTQDDLLRNDTTIIQNEHYFTQGFERNAILVANLINLEFLFSDEDADEYSLNRYFGLYVNEINEGTFSISGDGFYKNTEKSQLPEIKTVTQVSSDLNEKLEIKNERGVIIYIDPDKTVTTTGIPTPNRVNEVESIFYVKDKDEEFHTVKRGSLWKENQIRLFDKKIDISLLTGYKKPEAYTEGEIINKSGYSSAYFNISDEMLVGMSISFYDGEELIGQVFADESLTFGPGTYFECFFNPTGNPKEIAKAIKGAINFGINDDKRFFDATVNNDTVYLKTRYVGSRFNRLNFKLNYTEYPEFSDMFTSYPSYNDSDDAVNFVGGTNKNGTLLKVKIGDENRFCEGKYLKTIDGYTKILGWVPYLEEPKFNNEIQIGYNNIDDYVVIFTDDNKISVSSTGQVSLYYDYMPAFGRFSFFPVKDFDFDFYSTKLSEIGELSYEIANYNQFTDISTGETGNTIKTYTGISAWGDIRNFYDKGGFSNLIGLTREADPDISYDLNILSEYDRLEENFIRNQAVASRVVPYINKWGYIKNGTDVRNHSYRLNANLAFSVNNFAPSRWDVSRSATGYTCEWPYLCEFPSYFTDEAIQDSWSYIDTAPVDNVTSIINNETILTLGTFQRTDINYFDEYFIVDRFKTNNTINVIDKQLRYGRFCNGTTESFAEAFLRGVRIIGKPKAFGNEKQNFNARKLSYIRNGNFNDYRFSAMIVPNAPNKPKTQIKFIKNDKWKTVVMLIFVNINNSCINGNSQSIDRTTLYSINSIPETDTSCNPISNSYEETSLQGAIDFITSKYDGDTGSWLIRGFVDIDGNTTKFTKDISLNAMGEFNSIKFTIDDDTYLIQGITRILSDNEMYASTITKNGNPFYLPSPIPQSVKLKNATYSVIGGGFLGYSITLDSINFSELFNRVNNGDPSIIYETINTDGTQVLNADGSLSQTFTIELRAQDDFIKSTYVGILPDPSKPTIFNLTDIIGYELSLQKKPRITPISRHSGFYEPIANNIIFFKDPYIEVDFNNDNTSTSSTGSTDITDKVYKESVFNLCRFKNAQFNSSHANFGLLKNYFYHKVNEQDPSTVLELSKSDAFLSLYPLINEVGISYKDFYIFSSNWEPGYFTKSVDKLKYENVIGTQSMVEKNSFYASKNLKVPDKIILETFTASDFFNEAVNDPDLVDGTFMHEETNASIKFYLFINKRLKKYLYNKIEPVFEKYINPLYGFGDRQTLEDDVNKYVEENILKLYKLQSINFYVKYSREDLPPIYSTAELSNEDKGSSGLNITNLVTSQKLNANQFDTTLIYNKRIGFSESFGFSATLVKK